MHLYAGVGLNYKYNATNAASLIGGPFFYQSSGWDSFGTIHNIPVCITVGATAPDNFAGTLYVTDAG